jgi:hypothetical protein
MSDLRKAAEMALDAMVSFSTGTNKMFEGEFTEEIQALRQALAQPEQKPVAWRYRTVTFWNSRPQTRYLESLEGAEGLLGIEPLYTAPPKHEWVGLTVDEILDLLPSTEWKADVTLIFAKAVEAKLKEKNT